jgi:outer membrane receptor protein involved in Fe transport
MLPIRLLSLLLTLSVSLCASAQSGKLSGKLTDNKKNALAYATLTLLRIDSSVVNGGLSDDNGKFELDNIPAGNYLLRINALGLTTKVVGDISISEEKPVKDLGTVSLAISSKTLDEVQINGEKNVMEMQVDKKVFNVDKNITTAGGSATDVLANVPSVSVDPDGGLSLRGKGNVTVLIDGRPATLLGGDVQSALQSLPATSIDNIEIITNPGAKYDAQGVTGIINIITKRDKKFGLNGSVNAGAGTGGKYNGGLSLNAKNEKWNVFLNSNYRNNRNYNRTTTERENRDIKTSDLSFDNYENSQRRFMGWFNSLGAEYIIDKQNTITLTQNLNLMRWGNKGTTTFYTMEALQDGGTLLDTTNIKTRASEGRGGPLSWASNLDYKHKFKKEKQELTANFNYSISNTRHDQYYVTHNEGYDPIYSSYDMWELAPSVGVNSSINAQADFTTPFLSKNGKLDAGWKTQLFWYRSHNNPLQFNADVNTDTIFNPTFYNKFNYLQQNHAGYTSYSNQLGNFSYMAGLRLEYTSYDGKVQRLSKTAAFTPLKTDFLNLFPSAFLSYKLPKDQSIYLNASRRINRPNFWNMMPFVDLSNPQDTSMGNPYLRPEFIYNTELSYNKQFKKGHNIIASFYYQYTDGMIERYRKFYADGTSFSQPQNLNTGVTYGAELIAKMQLLPGWDATVNFNIFNNEVRGTNVAPELNNSGTAYFAKANTNIKLPKGFSLQLNGNYESPKILAQGTLSDVYWIDVALRKNVFKNKGTLVLNVSDILNTRKYTTNYDYNTYYLSSYRDRETRIGNISFTYRFGKDQNSAPQAKNTGGDKRPKKTDKKVEKPVEKERNNLKSDESEGGGGNSGGGK